MGPSPSPSSSPPSPPAGLSSTHLTDWFSTAMADRDTQILAQALTHELSTPPPCKALSNATSNASLESGYGRPYSLHGLKALEQQLENQQQRHEGLAAVMTVSAATDGSGVMPPYSHDRQEGLTVRENGYLQLASTALPSSNPGSPYNGVSTIIPRNSSLSVPTETLLARMSSNSQPEGLQANGSNSPNNPQTPAENFHAESSSLPSSRSACTALSGQAICGKVGKRRIRGSNRKSPIIVRSADVSDFRALVQQLTGISPTSSAQLYANSSMLKSQPVKNYANPTSLSTLDTSAALLLRSKPPLKDPLEGFSFTRKNHHQVASYLSSLGDFCDDTNLPPASAGSPLHGQQSMLGDQFRLSSSSPTLSSLWTHDQADNAKFEESSPRFVEANQFSTKEAMAGMNDFPPLAHFLPSDSWLFSDGVVANQAPHLEIARMA